MSIKPYYKGEIKRNKKTLPGAARTKLYFSR